jgi:hypothetical protein
VKGDFSRDSFDPHRPNTRVLRFQGSVDLDADWNEQVASLLFYHRDLAQALVGWHGSFDNGFRVEPLADPLKVRIARGSYYIDGVRAYKPYDEVLDLANLFPGPAGTGPAACLVYLEMWERVFTALEADEIREVALGGLDTSERARIVTVVRAIGLKASDVFGTRDDFQKLVEAAGRPPYWRRPRPHLRAWVPDQPSDSSAPKAKCAPIPGGGYGRPENQLYRVEIHDVDATAKKTFFKWSRDNGSALYPIKSVDVTPVPSAGGGAPGYAIEVTLTDPLGTSGVALVCDDWVELQCREVGAGDLIPLLMSVEQVDVGQSGETTVTFNTLAKVPGDKLPDYLTAGTNKLNHAFLRRWDFRTPPPDGTPPPPPALWDGVPVAGKVGMELEDGVFVKFDDPESCLPGDYWLIPARTITRDVVWPRDPRVDPAHPAAPPKTPEDRAWAVEARRPFHAFAPLGKVTPSGTAGAPPTVNELFSRRELPSLSPTGLDTNQQTDLITQAKSLVAPAEFTARLTKKQSVAAVRAPFYLHPEGLVVVNNAELKADLTNTPLSLGEIAPRSQDTWRKDLLLARKNKPLPDDGSEYMTQALKVPKAASDVTRLFGGWPSSVVTADDIKALGT